MVGAHERRVWDNLLKTVVDSGIFTAILCLHVLRRLLNLGSVDHLVLAVLVHLLVQEVVAVLLDLSVGDCVLQRGNLLRVDAALTVN